MFQNQGSLNPYYRMNLALQPLHNIFYNSQENSSSYSWYIVAKPPLPSYQGDQMTRFFEDCFAI